MKRYVLLLTTIILISSSGSAVWAGMEIKAEVDKQKLATDELLTYKLTISGDEKDIPAPRLPEFKGFNIISQAESASAALAKSNIKRNIVYLFVMVPKEEGEFKIEPSQIKFKGKTYQTPSFQIQVIQGKAKPVIPNPQQPTPPQEQPEEQKPQITL